MTLEEEYIGIIDAELAKNILISVDKYYIKKQKVKDTINKWITCNCKTVKLMNKKLKITQRVCIKCSIEKELVLDDK